MPISNDTIAEAARRVRDAAQLAESSGYASRAYRRAAETIRATPASVAELARERRRAPGVGPASPGGRGAVRSRIDQLDELEGTVRPELVALGRLLGSLRNG